MKVRNMTGRTGKGIANQFIIEIEDGFTTWEVLQSCQTPVAIKDDYEIKALSYMWDHSVTTAKNVGRFFNMSAKEIRKEIHDEKIEVYSEVGFSHLLKAPNQTLKFS